MPVLVGGGGAGVWGFCVLSEGWVRALGVCEGERDGRVSSCCP